MAALHKTSGNALWLMADRIFRMAISAVSWVMVVRHLGPEVFGNFSYLIAVYVLLAPVVGFGLDSVVVRDLVRHPEARHKLLSAALWVRLTMALACWCVMLAWVVGSGASMSTVEQSALIGFGLVGSVLDVIDLDFQSRQQSRLTVLAKSAPFLLSCGLRIWVALNGGNLLWLAGAVAAEAVLGGAALWLMALWHKVPLTWGAFDRQEISRLVRAGLPFLASGIAVVVYMRIDQVMVLEINGATELGLYAGATRLSEFLYFFPTIIVSSAAPVLYELRERDPEQFTKRLGALIGGLAALGMAGAVALSATAPWLTGVVLGDAYRGSAAILTIHAWSLIFVCVGVGQSIWDAAEGQGRWVLVRTASGALANVVLNLWLLPLYGGVGAAIATLIAYALSAWVANLFGRATRPVFWLQLRSPLLFWNALGSYYARLG